MQKCLVHSRFLILRNLLCKVSHPTSLHTPILEASAAPENDAGVAEPGVQGVQLHTHYLLLP